MNSGSKLTATQRGTGRVSGLAGSTKKKDGILATSEAVLLTIAENLRTSRGYCEGLLPMKSWSRNDPKRRGSPLGTLVHIGENKPAKVTITAFNYTGSRCDERSDLSADGLAPPTDESVTWVDIGGVHKMDILESFGKQFQLHPLLLEDIANTDQRPKIEDYETCLFLVIKMLSVTDRQEIIVEQVSLVLGRNFVLSFQENGVDVFTSVRDRLRGGKGRLRQSGGSITCSMRWSTPLSINTSRCWRC